MNRTTYRLAAGTLLAGGIWLALSTADEPAHAADDKPTPAASLLELTERVVEQATDTPEPPAEPEPSEPAEEPADEPTEPPVEDRPRTDPAPPAEPAPTIPAPTLPPVDVPPVIIDPPIADPIEVDLPPVEAPTPPAEQPPLVTLPPTSDPVQVEVLAPTGPAPATQLPLDGVPLELYPHGVRAIAAPVCEDELEPERDYQRGEVRRILDRITGLTAAKPSRPYKPCPGDHGTPNATNAAIPAVKPPGGYGADLVGADMTAAIGHPGLTLLRHIWPRAHLPGGRTEHPEPGPA